MSVLLALGLSVAIAGPADEAYRAGIAHAREADWCR